MQLKAGHMRHMDVRDQAVGMAHGIRRQEILCGREGLDCEPERVYQRCDGYANILIIINDRNEGPGWQTRLLDVGNQHGGTKPLAWSETLY